MVFCIEVERETSFLLGDYILDFQENISKCIVEYDDCKGERD